MDYKQFLDKKKIVIENSGFDIDVKEMNNKLFEYQKDIVKWALKIRTIRKTPKPTKLINKLREVIK